MYSDGYLQQQVQSKLTYKNELYFIETSLEGEDKAINYIENSACDGVVVLQAAWKPPIGEAVEFISDIRETIAQKEIVVALLGKPVDGQQEKVEKNDYKMWANAILKLGDPFTSVVCLGEKDE